jgi:hypothetical protein
MSGSARTLEHLAQPGARHRDPGRLDRFARPGLARGLRAGAQGHRRGSPAARGVKPDALPSKPRAQPRRLWKNVKRDRVGRTGIDSQEDLKGKALAALCRLQKLQHLIRGFFHDPNLRYITA